MNTYSFTYVISYRHRIDRFNNLKRVLDWINGFGGVDVILVEQDTHSKISHLNLKARQVFLKSDKPYNKYWAFNVASKMAKTNIIIFGDSQTIIEPKYFIESIQKIDKFDFINPFNKTINIPQNQSGLQMNDLFKIEQNDVVNSICENISIFRKEAFNRIGGWNEDFIGEGEHMFMSKKVKEFLNWTEEDNKGYKFFYEEEPNIKILQNNSQLLQSLVNLSKDDLTRSINMSLQKIGMINKYDKI
jgi:cellulose synthase/poly-beta-1,6-N-acetylglucosamine synthase-like glycosyltransferase